MEFVDGSTLTRFGIKGTNYCGPGYTGGRLLDPGERGNTKTVPPTGPVDEACRKHDEAYGEAENSPNPAYDRLTANLRLISDINLLEGRECDGISRWENIEALWIQWQQ